MDLIEARSIFSPATGFIQRGGFEWTCNPYVGCTFGCSYCYAMFLPQNRRPKDQWGKWITAKRNAVEVARKQAPKVAGQTVYMSSVTDPYQPAERGLALTRGILEVLIPHQPRLLIQTRGPMLIRDIDLFAQFDQLRINMSIPTDSEEIRAIFEPKAPPLKKRWQALAEARAAGITVGICVTPMLPLTNPDSFIDRLIDFAPDVLVVQDFHESQGGFGADTGEKARELLKTGTWTSADYEDVRDRLAARVTTYEGENGFFPPGQRDVTPLSVDKTPRIADTSPVG